MSAPEVLTPEEADLVSTTIKVISECMGVSYGRAREACLSAVAALAVEGRDKT